MIHANVSYGLEVDPVRKLVTVGAGATVNQVLKELRKYNLTLQNFSSIQEQQIGGWTQVAAHGTGCQLPTVDEMIQRMTIVSPRCGPISLSRYIDASYNTAKNDVNSSLFDFARVGLVLLELLLLLFFYYVTTIVTYTSEYYNAKLVSLNIVLHCPIRLLGFIA